MPPEKNNDETLLLQNMEDLARAHGASHAIDIVWSYASRLQSDVREGRITNGMAHEWIGRLLSELRSKHYEAKSQDGFPIGHIRFISFQSEPDSDEDKTIRYTIHHEFIPMVLSTKGVIDTRIAYDCPDCEGTGQIEAHRWKSASGVSTPGKPYRCSICGPIPEEEGRTHADCKTCGGERRVLR